MITAYSISKKNNRANSYNNCFGRLKISLTAIFLLFFTILTICFLPLPAEAVENRQQTERLENQAVVGSEDYKTGNLQRPVDPYPKNQASGVDINTFLQWHALQGSEYEDIYYLIYFGTTKDPELLAAIWPDNSVPRIQFEPGPLEVDGEYFWKVEARNSVDNMSRSHLWSFNTFGAISGRVSEGEKILAGVEVIFLAYQEDGSWEQVTLVETTRDGSYQAADIPSGKYLVGLADKSCWYPELLIVNGGHFENINLDISTYDLELVLSEGMNLLSLPRWAKEDGIIFPQPFEEYIESWMTYWEGAWSDGSCHESLIEALNNPVRAIYINIKQPTVVRFKWKELTIDLKYARQLLQPGWNLISSASEEDYRLVLIGLADFGTGGITDVSAPNELNNNKEFNYSLPWEIPVVNMVAPPEGTKPVMYPLDGYWVYLNGGSITYETIVSTAAVERKINDEPVEIED